MDILEILQKYWGHKAFRPLQEDIINSVLQGNDTLALLPTGGGKSVCFQVPALACEGLCLVVSPLIALMKDQVEHLKNKNIPAAAIFSGMNKYEIEITLNQAVYGKIKFLYVSPERLKTDIFIAHLQQMKLGLIAIDEAHCISQWGYDFRPPYLEIAEIRKYHPQAPVIALTATATQEVIKDICHKLSFKENHQIFRKSFERKNLSYVVFHEEDKMGRLLRLMQNVKGSGLVYVRNRRRTQEIAEYLKSKGYAAGFYHAGLSSKERDYRQQLWMTGQTPVMVATNAFGMGIDKDNVRFVVHLDLPESPEAYFQEAGRGGRDEKLAYAVILCNEADIANLKKQLDEAFPDLKYLKNIYQAVGNYFQVPVGSGQDSVFDFDLKDFCRNYNFNTLQTFNALRFLEKEGYFLLPEKEESTSKIYIPLNKEQLYVFQVENKRFDDFLKLLLRSYGGLFTGFVTIQEKELAKRIGSTEESVTKVLEQLEKYQVIIYQKRSEKPQLIFTRNRLPVENVAINEALYKQLKTSAEQRIQAMVNYVSSNEKCRSLLLLEYFGEQNAEKCGHCDICLAEKKSQRNEELKKQQSELQSKILLLLQEEPLTQRELIGQLGILHEKFALELVQQMLDAGLLKRIENMKLTVVS